MTVLTALAVLACAPAPPQKVATTPDCASCHPAQDAAWRASQHAHAQVDPARHADVLGSPPTVSLDAGDGLRAHAVVGVIGVAPLWQPLVPMSGGRIQASPLAWVPGKGRWVDLFAHDPRPPDAWGHWTGQGMTWNRQCAGCHVTGLRVGWDPLSDTYETTYEAAGVTCAACHGDSAAHARNPSQPPAVRGTPQQARDTCEACHMAGSPLVDAPVPGEPILSTLLPLLPGLDPEWQPDGQLLGERFEGVSFRLSAMHRAGLTCTTCHEPHGAGLVKPAEALCTGCHVVADDAPSPALPTGHSRHGPDVGCLDCHMPTRTYMVLDDRHDHSFPVPDVALALAQDLPLACAACHDRPTLEAAAPAWPARPERRRRVAALSDPGGPDARDRLLEALRTEDHPTWRAALLGALGPWPRAAADLARAAATEQDPWLRMAAARTLAPDDAALPALLRDPVPAVALEAARRMSPMASPAQPRMHAYEDWLTRFGDHPAIAAEHGAWLAGHGRPVEALPHLRRALLRDPDFTPAARNLAVAQATLGRGAEATATLRKARARSPGDAELARLLALAVADADSTEAIALMVEARALDPADAYAARQHGALLASQGQIDEALAALTDAARLAPADPRALVDAAQLALRHDKLPAARAALDALRQRTPHHPAIAALEAALGPRP